MSRSHPRPMLLAGTRFLLVVAATAIILTGLHGGAAAYSQDGGFEDPFAFEAERPKMTVRPGEKSEAVVVALVPMSHHLYETSLEGSPLKVSGSANATFSYEAAMIPDAHEEPDPFEPGKTIRIFPDGTRFVVPFFSDANTAPGNYELVVQIYYQGCSEMVCFPPTIREVVISVDVAGEPVTDDSAPVAPTAEPTADTSTEPGDTPEATGPAPSSNGSPLARLESLEAKYGLLAVYLFCFVIGAGLVLTPCVFPMAALTGSVFGARATAAASDGGGGSGSPIPTAMLFGLGLGVSFGTFGVIAGAAGTALNTAAAFQNPWILGAICSIFVLLSLSMFGLYDLKPPRWVTDRYQNASEQGSYVAFFLMGMLAALVAAPCAGPPVLALGAFVAPKGPVMAGSLLFTTGIGLAAPFVILGIASSSGRVRLRPGAWMETVKRFFGVILIACAIYFGESLLGGYYPLIAGLFATVVGVCSGALDRMEPTTGGFARASQSFGVVSLVLGLYFFGGWLLSEGLIHPPVKLSQGGAAAAELEWETDIDAALARAQSDGRPVMVDFTATWCLYCKTIERNAFTDARVVAALKRFVLIKIDVTRGGEPSDHAWKRVNGPGQPPWLAFFDSKGTLLDTRQLGYQGGVITGPDLAKILESIK